MAIELKSLSDEQLIERLQENFNFLRVLRLERQTLDDQIMSISFSNDDINAERASRREPLRIVGGSRG